MEIDAISQSEDRKNICPISVSIKNPILENTQVNIPIEVIQISLFESHKHTVHEKKRMQYFFRLRNEDTIDQIILKRCCEEIVNYLRYGL